MTRSVQYKAHLRIEDRKETRKTPILGLAWSSDRSIVGWRVSLVCPFCMSVPVFHGLGVRSGSRLFCVFLSEFLPETGIRSTCLTWVKGKEESIQGKRRRFSEIICVTKDTFNSPQMVVRRRWKHFIRHCSTTKRDSLFQFMCLPCSLHARPFIRPQIRFETQVPESWDAGRETECEAISSFWSTTYIFKNLCRLLPSMHLYHST